MNQPNAINFNMNDLRDILGDKELKFLIMLHEIKQKDTKIAELTDKLKKAQDEIKKIQDEMRTFTKIEAA